jgi:hypothetical protein
VLLDECVCFFCENLALVRSILESFFDRSFSAVFELELEIGFRAIEVASCTYLEDESFLSLVFKITEVLGSVEVGGFIGEILESINLKNIKRI